MNQEIFFKIMNEILENIDEGVHFVNKEGKTIIYNNPVQKMEKINRHDILTYSLVDIVNKMKINRSTLLEVLEKRLIAKITDRVVPLAHEWQNRPLDMIYPIVFMYAIHYKVRSEGRIINKVAYVALSELSLLEAKWTQKIRNWTQILAHLSIYFEERILTSS